MNRKIHEALVKTYEIRQDSFLEIYAFFVLDLLLFLLALLSLLTEFKLFVIVSVCEGLLDGSHVHLVDEFCDLFAGYQLIQSIDRKAAYGDNDEIPNHTFQL